MNGNFPNQPERHECDRVCKKGEPAKICWYRFTVAAHTTMGKLSIIIICFVFMTKNVVIMCDEHSGQSQLQLYSVL